MDVRGCWRLWCWPFAMVVVNVSAVSADGGRELHIEATDCGSIDRQLFAELLVLDLRDEGEVIDRALTVALSCQAESLMIRAAARDGGGVIERAIPPARTNVGTERVLALATSEMLRVARWTEPEPQAPEERSETEIVVERGTEAESETESETESEAESEASRKGSIGVAPLVQWRFPEDRLVTFGAELRGGVQLKGSWWFVSDFGFEHRRTDASLGDVKVLVLTVSAGAAWRHWWSDRVGWDNALLIGAGFARLKGAPNNSTVTGLTPSTVGLTQRSAIFSTRISAGPRWRFGRAIVGADLRLGVTVPRLEEAPPLGAPGASADRFALGLAYLGGALTLDVELGPK